MGSHITGPIWKKPRRAMRLPQKSGVRRRRQSPKMLIGAKVLMIST